MSGSYDSIFDNFSFQAELAFTGNYCGNQLAYIEHRTGFIHFVKSGKAEILIPGYVPIQVTKPSLVFFPRPHTHCLRALDPAGADLVCAQVTFNVGFHNPLALSFPDVLVVELAEMSSIKDILKVFFLEATSDSFGRKKITDSLCLALLIYMSRQLVESGAIKTGALSALGDKKMSKALELIHTKYADSRRPGHQPHVCIRKCKSPNRYHDQHAQASIDQMIAGTEIQGS